MAEAKGSPASSGGAGVGPGDHVGAVVPPVSLQALLASMGGPAGGAANMAHHHQQQQFYNPAAALIHAPMPGLAAPPPLAVRTPPPPPHCAQQSNHHQLLPAGTYQYWQASGSQNGVEAAAQQVQRGFGDWTVYNSSYVSLACGSSSSNNGYHQASRLCPTTAWPNFMPVNPCYGAYPPAMPDHQAPSYQGNNNHEEDSGFVASFRVDPTLVPAPCFPPMSPASNNHSPAQFFDEATYAKNVKSESMYKKKVKNSEEPPDMESENSDELDHVPVDENQNLSQWHESLTTARFNCREYRVVVRKDLTNSDVGNIGRIVLPKRDAEANLPALLERDGLVLRMDDFKLPSTWNFKYRFWPNNKSRMYIMESTGDFVKSHNLEAGDALIIYKSESGKFIVRGEKATPQRAHLLCLECKEEGGNSEECGFAMSLHAKRT